LAGCSATDARANQQKLESLLDKLSGTPGPQSGRKLEVRLVSIDPFKVIASRHVGPPDGLFKAFGDLFNWAEKTGLLEDYRGIHRSTNMAGRCRRVNSTMF
jgi:AraC family transcriptional regulator